MEVRTRRYEIGGTNSQLRIWRCKLGGSNLGVQIWRHKLGDTKLEARIKGAILEARICQFRGTNLEVRTRRHVLNWIGTILEVQIWRHQQVFANLEVRSANLEV